MEVGEVILGVTCGGRIYPPPDELDTVVTTIVGVVAVLPFTSVTIVAKEYAVPATSPVKEAEVRAVAPEYVSVVMLWKLYGVADSPEPASEAPEMVMVVSVVVVSEAVMVPATGTSLSKFTDVLVTEVAVFPPESVPAKTNV